MPNEELAIIREIGVGMRDTNAPIVWFTAHSLSGSALQIWSWEEAGRVMKDNSIENIMHLAGRACVVSHEPGLIRFVRLFSL